MNEHLEHAADSVIDDADNSGLKNNYYLGKRMTPAAFKTEQDYLVGRRRLINAAIHGWGVVRGLAVSAPADTPGKLAIGAGVALDRHGRELVQLAPRTLALADVLSPAQIKQAEDPECSTCWILRAHYAERREQPVKVCDHCGCERTEWESARETIAYTLAPIDCDECSAPPVLGERYCDCDGNPDGGAGALGDRGPHACLCAHLCEQPAPHPPASLCEVRPGLFMDPHHGVRLACVTLAKDACGKLAFGGVSEGCAPRRLVIGNDMLYDLIRGRDLTRIDAVSWTAWLANDVKVDWKDFAAMFHADQAQTGFTLTFSGPVQPATLTANAFVIRVTFNEATGGWGETLRIPMRRPHYDDASHTVTLAVSKRWVSDEILQENSRFRGSDAIVEIEARGDLILDLCGQAVDANARAIAWPSGNGSPGGSHLSVFTVKQRYVENE
ncbi:MAG: hypothetical protein ABIT83_18655 [Massilia sp.]